MLGDANISLFNPSSWKDFGANVVSNFSTATAISEIQRMAAAKQKLSTISQYPAFKQQADILLVENTSLSQMLSAVAYGTDKSSFITLLPQLEMHIARVDKLASDAAPAMAANPPSFTSSTVSTLETFVSQIPTWGWILLAGIVIFMITKGKQR